MSEFINPRETRFRDQYKFLPTQSQVHEDIWEFGGLFCGRDVQEVYASDTEELIQSGVSWDQAIRFLKCVGLYSAYLDDVARKKLLRLWKKHQKDPRGYTLAMTEYMQDVGKLPGFNGTVLLNFTSSREGYRDDANPVYGAGPIYPASPTPLDTIAYLAFEKSLIVPDQFKTYVNRLTLYMADSFRMLEKGNRYQLTGAQLAGLTTSFDEEAFFMQIQPWLEKRLGSSQE